MRAAELHWRPESPFPEQVERAVLIREADRLGLQVSDSDLRRELSTGTGTRSSTLTGVLDRLESRGYLSRELDPTDRRSFRLPLTEAGQAVAARVQAAVTGLERDALAGLSATQIAGFHTVVNALLET